MHLKIFWQFILVDIQIKNRLNQWSRYNIFDERKSTFFSNGNTMIIIIKVIIL